MTAPTLPPRRAVAECRAAAHLASLTRTAVMVMRYEHGETMQAIGADYDITRERVRQLLKRVGVTGAGRQEGAG